MRIPAQTLETGLRDLRWEMGQIFVGLVGALMIATVAFVRAFVRPISALADDATAIANGEDVYPCELKRTRELAALSAALARLQNRGG